jgi:NTP pyrophosphatase (non-canonical NTP hydrolase)
MAQHYLGSTSNDDLIEELQKRGMTVVPGGQEVKSGRKLPPPPDDLPPGQITMGLSISEWQEKVHDWAVGKGWWDDPNPNVPEKLMLIVTEVAEAMEDYRNGLDLAMLTSEADRKPCGFPSEMADIVIRVLDFCGHFGIDLEATICLKHQYNETRPHKHGGKLC